MPSPKFSSDMLECMYENQLALEAAIMEFSICAANRGGAQAGEDVSSALETEDRLARLRHKALPKGSSGLLLLAA